MRTLYALIVPVLAVITALVLGAVIIAATGGDVAKAYQGLWEGSLGRPRSISDTLVRTTPYIFGGLAVALAFKGGLFNIGVEGQITIGSLATAFVGYALPGVPFPLHLLPPVFWAERSGAPSLAS
jgi:general nucleoside transport system permease protein